jgi:histone deacetylase complex regulatory component SIN3
LFNAAPDLLEDFKQFLPESAAHAKAVKAAEDNLAAMASSQTQATPGARLGEPAKMPPMGNFSVPPSSSKENKKAQRGNAVNGPPVNASESATRTMSSSHPNKVSDIHRCSHMVLCNSASSILTISIAYTKLPYDITESQT